MKTFLKILISITLTPLAILLLFVVITIGIYETLWNSKKGEIDVE
jgi:uncharacterized membrane protein